MKTLIPRLTALAAALSLLAALHAEDAAKPKAPKAEKTVKADQPAGAEAAKAGKPYPFRGTVAAVDKQAMTFSLEGKEKLRVISLGSQSILQKEGKPATLGQLAVGDHISGRVEKHGEDEVVLKASVGPQPEKKAAGDEPKPKKTKKAETAEPAPAK